MSYYAGIDVSTLAIDVVLLDEDTNRAEHHRRRLDIGPGKALTRIRRIQDAMPARRQWADSGVLAIAIEEPYNRASMSGQVPILMAIGGILQTIPTNIHVGLMRADDWRRACGLPTRGQRQDLKAAAIDFARRNWTNAPAHIDDNAADAYGLAWAMRELAEKHHRETATHLYHNAIH